MHRRYRQLKANHGAVIAILFLPKLLFQAIRGHPVPSWPDASGVEFDREYGVSTTGILPLAHSLVNDSNWVYGFDYQAVEVFDIEAILDPFDIDYATTVFVDLGAGKGRALMCAAKAPFKRVVGVEISPQLVACAKRNIDIYTANSGSVAPIEISREDVAHYRLPLEPLVLFLYNPFSSVVMTHLINNLLLSLAQSPRRIVVVYFRPELAELWALAPGFDEAGGTLRYKIFEYAPHALDNSFK